MKREDWQKEAWKHYQRIGRLLYARPTIPLSYAETFEQQNGTGPLIYQRTFIRFSERDIPIEHFAHNSPPPPTLTA